jgi:hypothetical protein
MNESDFCSLSIKSLKDFCSFYGFDISFEEMPDIEVAAIRNNIKTSASFLVYPKYSPNDLELER